MATAILMEIFRKVEGTAACVFRNIITPYLTKYQADRDNGF